MTEYIAQYQVCKQVSPDDWALVKTTIRISEYTTIRELMDTVKERERTIHLSPEFEIHILQITEIRKP